MNLYNKTLTLTADAIDLAAVEYIPAEGKIIPLSLDAIDGLAEQLYQHGYYSDPEQNKIIELVYAYSFEDTEDCCLCIKYTNGGIEVIPSTRFQMELSELQLIGCCV